MKKGKVRFHRELKPTFNQKNRQIERPADRKTGRQRDRQTERQADRQTEKHQIINAGLLAVGRSAKTKK